jgi:putative sigma-54 modulation protein
MNITISFKNLEHTPALDEKIRIKTNKLKKYLGGKTDVHWVCYIQEGKHYADIKLTGPAFQYLASANTDNMYKTLDQAISKIEKQLQKKKEMWKNKIHKKHNDIEFENENEENQEEFEEYESK